MYEELVKDLRYLAKVYSICNNENTKEYNLAVKAADAIENLDDICQHQADEIRELKNQWIPVTERLPEDNEAVNVVWVNHNPVFYYQHIKDKPQTSTGVYYRGQWYWWSAVTQDYLAEYGKWEPDLMDSAIEVTHWMPLPEPPKEE